MGQHVCKGHQCQGRCLGLPGLACVCMHKCVDVCVYVASHLFAAWVVGGKLTDS